jgi:hypothetical protein
MKSQNEKNKFKKFTQNLMKSHNKRGHKFSDFKKIIQNPVKSRNKKRNTNSMNSKFNKII